MHPLLDRSGAENAKELEAEVPHGAHDGKRHRDRRPRRQANRRFAGRGYA